jgi:hypothetical protein
MYVISRVSFWHMFSGSKLITIPFLTLSDYVYQLRNEDTLCAGFEVLTAVTMKRTIFWDVLWCDVSEKYTAPILRLEE